MTRQCMTHHYACDCREELHKAEIARLQTELDDYKNSALHSADDLRAKDAEIARNVEDAKRWRYLVAENNKGLHGKYRICWLDPRRDGFITTDGVSCNGKDHHAIVRVIDEAMKESGE